MGFLLGLLTWCAGMTGVVLFLHHYLKNKNKFIVWLVYSIGGGLSGFILLAIALNVSQSTDGFITARQEAERQLKSEKMESEGRKFIASYDESIYKSLVNEKDPIKINAKIWKISDAMLRLKYGSEHRDLISQVIAMEVFKECSRPYTSYLQQSPEEMRKEFDKNFDKVISIVKQLKVIAPQSNKSMGANLEPGIKGYLAYNRRMFCLEYVYGAAVVDVEAESGRSLAVTINHDMEADPAAKFDSYSELMSMVNKATPGSFYGAMKGIINFSKVVDSELKKMQFEVLDSMNEQTYYVRRQRLLEVEKRLVELTQVTQGQTATIANIKNDISARMPTNLQLEYQKREAMQIHEMMMRKPSSEK